MFTGIIEEIGTVISAKPGGLTVAAGDILKGLSLGGSIALNGVCLTVTSLQANAFTTDVMAETLKRTNLGMLKTGDRVNLESPLVLGGPLGGHLVQGHIDAAGRITSIRWDGEAMLVGFEAPPEVMRYVVEKGFIAVDGVSLTVVARDAGTFQVSVVAHSRRNTIIEKWQIGDLVNLEVDIIAKYVEQVNQPRGTGITADFLREHGFSVS